MFKAFDFFQDAIKSCNVFTSPVNLRYKLDPDYNTFAGGIVSIILILLLISVFFNQWMTLLNKKDISSSTEVIRQFDPTYLSVSSNNFMFAVGVNGINLTEYSQKKYFDLTMSRVQVIKGQKLQIKHYPFTLEPCKQSHWQQFGQDFVQTYNRQGISSYLCPPRDTLIQVIGKWTSQNFTYLQISFDKCKGPNCRSQQQIKAWTESKKSFYFNFFYSNTLLNPDQTQPISMFLQDKDFTMFSPSLGTFTNLYLGQYKMQTDQSLFPWFDKKLQKGYIVNQAEKETLTFIPGQNEAYCQLFLRKSNIKLQIQRKFRKVDDLLSYIGGLFGIIAVAVGFVMNYYGQCSFELQMCQKIFDYHNKKQDKSSIKQHTQSANGLEADINPNLHHIYNIENGLSNTQIQTQNQDIFEPKDFGFFDFFLHILVYLPLKKYCNIKWRRMQIYEESLEEMRQKLDISQLMEKLAFYDRSISALFDESQLKLLYLQEKFNFQEVRQERNMLGLRQGIVANLFQSKQENYNDGTELTSQEEKKWPLNEIANRKSNRISTYLGGQMNRINLVQILVNQKQKNKILQKDEVNLNLPNDIQKALVKLDKKIQKGDIVSTRIYNGLQYELLEAYQKSMMNKNRYGVTSKKIMKRVRNKKEEGLNLKDMTRAKDYANYVISPSLTSINNLNSNNQHNI